MVFKWGDFFTSKAFQSNAERTQDGELGKPWFKF